jgi:hypothetical protein
MSQTEATIADVDVVIEHDRDETGDLIGLVYDAETLQDMPDAWIDQHMREITSAMYGL